MIIDWLDPKYPSKHPGSPPKSGAQDKPDGKTCDESQEYQ